MEPHDAVPSLFLKEIYIFEFGMRICLFGLPLLRYSKITILLIAGMVGKTDPKDASLSVGSVKMEPCDF